MRPHVPDPPPSGSGPLADLTAPALNPRASPAVLAGVAIVAAFLAHALYLAAITDDAYITFRYARNLAAGHGWVWNPGGPPVEGFTSPLWVVVNAAWLALGADPARMSQLLGLLAGALTLVYTARFAHRHLGLSPLASWTPAVILAAAGPFATWATSGMETSAFTLLVLAGAFHALNAMRTGSGRQRWAAYGLLLLAGLTRPEGGLFVVVIGAFDVFRAHARRAIGSRLAPALAYAAAMTALVAWRMHVFGFPLPNTFYAKTGLGPFVVLRGAVYSTYFAFHYLLPWLPMALAAALAGRAQPSPADGVDEPRDRRRTWHMTIALAASYVAYIVMVGGDYMAMYRFFVPALPFFALLLGTCVVNVFEAAGTSRRGVAIVGLVAGIALTLVHSTPADSVLFGAPRGQQGHWSGVQNERWAVARFSAIGKFFDARKHSRDETLATPVIGAMAWFGDLRVLDLFGLTDVHIAHARTQRPPGRGFPGHERSDYAYAARQRPEYIFIRIVDQREQPQFPVWGAEADSLLRGAYVPREARLDDARLGVHAWLYYLERGDLEPIAEPPDS